MFAAFLPAVVADTDGLAILDVDVDLDFFLRFRVCRLLPGIRKAGQYNQLLRCGNMRLNLAVGTCYRLENLGKPFTGLCGCFAVKGRRGTV